MSDNITIQGFHSLFNYTMDEVLQHVSDIPLTWLYLGLINFLVFGSLLRMMQDSKGIGSNLKEEHDCFE